jgi:hypothetical protein
MRTHPALSAEDLGFQIRILCEELGEGVVEVVCAGLNEWGVAGIFFEINGNFESGHGKTLQICYKG